MEDKPPKKGSQDCRCLSGIVGLVLVAPGSHTTCVGSLVFWLCAVVVCSLLCAGLNTTCLSVFVLGMDQLFSAGRFSDIPATYGMMMFCLFCALLLIADLLF